MTGYDLAKYFAPAIGALVAGGLLFGLTLGAAAVALVWLFA